MKQTKEYEYVDLGLPSGLKWAKCNVGAKKETDYGDYFMWGSAKSNTKTTCNWMKNPFNNGLDSCDEEYFNAHKSEWLDDNDNLKSEYDAARTNMGGDWRMPTKDDFQELLDNTDSEWVHDYNGTGVGGRKFTSKTNGNSIFFPICGYYDNGGVYLRESYSSTSSGSYWSSSRRESDFSDEALSLHFNLGYVNSYSSCPHKYGFCIRPVMDTIKINLEEQCLWYCWYDILSSRFPSASKSWVVNEVNKIVYKK